MVRLVRLLIVEFRLHHAGKYKAPTVTTKDAPDSQNITLMDGSFLQVSRAAL